MKKSINHFRSQLKCVTILFFFAAIIVSPSLQAQMDYMVKGKIVEEESEQPVPYATVVMVKSSEDSTRFMTGAITDEQGSFTINRVESGKYSLKASSVGYKTSRERIDILDTGIYDAGIIYLRDSVQFIDEVIVLGERPKGKTEHGRTIFFMNKKILAASDNAPDLLRHIPGIQVDLKQNISLEGSRDIILFVNGKKRDKSYISQLNPSLIDRVEIMNTPPPNYEGNVSGVINIILKKENDTGFSGHFFTEIPTSGSIVYSFPAYSIQYGSPKFNLYTSYNGEINYENIDETTERQISGAGQAVSINSVEKLRQKNISHNFHYGFDYYATDQDIISYYGSVNPYSYEQDGKVFMDVSGDENLDWNTRRQETDKNLDVFNSLYYKHLFSKQGSELVIDISNSYLRTSSSVFYLNEDESGTASILNNEKPKQLSTSIKIDYSTPLGENLMLNTGAKGRVKSMQNETAASFGYNEQVYALYGMLNYKEQGYNIDLGLRTEYSETWLKNDFNKTELSVLPYLAIQYKINDKENILLSYRRSVNRPNVFQLNPYIYNDNPYSVRKGNPLLEPEFKNRIYAEHSIRFNIGYVAYRLFYENLDNAISNLTFLNDSAAFETQVQNLGNSQQAGIQLLGSLKFGPLTISPVTRLYRQSTSGNSLAKQYNIGNRKNWVFDAGFSSVLSFKHDFAFSATFQYSTAKYNIQENTFCDALYFLSLDKTFKNKIKVGIMTALPFVKTYVYQGTEIEAQNFTSSYHGNLKLPVVPLMFSISYQFRSGKERALINREKGDNPKRPRSGL